MPMHFSDWILLPAGRRAGVALLPYRVQEIGGAFGLLHLSSTDNVRSYLTSLSKLVGCTKRGHSEKTEMQTGCSCDVVSTRMRENLPIFSHSPTLLYICTP